MTVYGFGREAGRDWGGRRPLNPPDCPRVDAADVHALALRLGLELKRDGRGMWFYRRPGKGWRTLGMTNFLALEFLQRLEGGQA